MASKQLSEWLRERRHWCLSLVRIYLGLGLFIKGIGFAANREELTQLVVERDISFAVAALVHYIIMAHILGGFLMAIGLGTRAGALIQIPILVGAVFFIHWAGGVFTVAEELRFSALVLFLLLIFVWHGSGALSVDSYWRRKGVPK